MYAVFESFYQTLVTETPYMFAYKRIASSLKRITEPPSILPPHNNPRQEPPIYDVILILTLTLTLKLTLTLIRGFCPGEVIGYCPGGFVQALVLSIFNPFVRLLLCEIKFDTFC